MHVLTAGILSVVFWLALIVYLAIAEPAWVMRAVLAAPLIVSASILALLAPTMILGGRA